MSITHTEDPGLNHGRAWCDKRQSPRKNQREEWQGRAGIETGPEVKDIAITRRGGLATEDRDGHMSGCLNWTEVNL